MTAKKRLVETRMETLDAESIALIVSQLSALMHHREDRIIIAVEKMLKPITDTFKSNGGTLDRLVEMMDGIDEKITAFEARMNSYEKKTDARIERIEREITERKKS